MEKKLLVSVIIIILLVILLFTSYMVKNFHMTCVLSNIKSLALNMSDCAR